MAAPLRIITLTAAGAAPLLPALARLRVAVFRDRPYLYDGDAASEADHLVPTCTDTAHGFSRVRIAARARATENQSFVAVAPTVGAAPWSAALDENVGPAGIFGPVDRGFAAHGILAEGEMGAGGRVFAELDPARLEAVRREGAVRNHLSRPAAVPVARPAEFA